MTNRRQRRLRPDDLTSCLNDTWYPFVEDDQVTGLYGYGHINPAAFVEKINNYDRDAELRPEDWDPESAYSVEDVMHEYAIAEAAEGFTVIDEDNWVIKFVDKDEDGAMPITYVNR